MSVTLEKVIAPPDDAEEPAGPGPYTVEDFYRLVPEGVKADLIDGWIYRAMSDTDESDALNCFLLFLLKGYADVKDAGRVSASRFAYRLTERNAPEPDVAFVAKERLATVERLGGTAAPDIAVEIAAKESRGRDYGAKFRLYEQTGTREYWIIDPLERQVHFYRHHDGNFVEVEAVDGVFRSEALPGFWLKVDWLLARPLPGAYACLQEILA